MTRVLFCGPATSPILSFLFRTERWVQQCDAALTEPGEVDGYDWLVSHGYRHIVPAAVLAPFDGRTVNCHISYLPWNRGAHPNVWAWYDGTPHGVTLHRMTAGLDKGPIWAQHRLTWARGHTLATTYAELQGFLGMLFARTWEGMRRGSLVSGSLPPPKGRGSYHAAADLERLRPLLAERGWDTPVQVLIEAGKKARGE